MSVQKIAVLFSLILCSLSNFLLAQSTPAIHKGSIRVGSNEQLPAQAKYLYPQFSQGVVHLCNGQTPAARLNCQLQLREIQFLNPKGDVVYSHRRIPFLIIRAVGGAINPKGHPESVSRAQILNRPIPA